MVRDPVVRGRGQVKGVAPVKMEKAAAVAVRAGEKDPDKAAAKVVGTIAMCQSKCRWEWR